MASITVFLGFGSNMGSREGHLGRGLALLARSLELVATSSVYETDPWGFTEQPPFLNMVCYGCTDMVPAELLLCCQDVERQVGRKPAFRYGPRVLDIDILAYGDQVIETPGLVIPHPSLHERAFVLVPLAEIAPEWEHPVLRKRASQLLAEVSGREGVRLWGGPLAVASGR
ncbi:MAG: 2-amino-4-hydroxy-6-hydroxymethyldihydropteridine diphosphokinase [Dehalococcoidia bacterium]|nr:2-amino-4-hydroxy-6-hydroxymethyldihydropteridine diphosphokinase [Dehalococcoidia bacterium]